MLEPPGFQLHLRRDDTGLVSHTAFVERYDGPRPFFAADGALID